MAPSPRFIRILDEMARLRAAMKDLDASLEVLEVEMMRLLHDHGLSWQAVADERGVSRQAISDKYREPQPVAKKTTQPRRSGPVE
jgi:predicted DNA-binding protein YlxM (UPF0122 family)